MLSVISWYGGKYKMAKQIINIMPNHTHYVDVFGGGAHVLLNKPRSSVEVYNDINKGLFCLFNTLRNKEHAELLKLKLDLTPYSRNEFEYAKSDWFNSYIEVEKEIEELNARFNENLITESEYKRLSAELEKKRLDTQIEVARRTYILSKQSFSSVLTNWRKSRKTLPRLVNDYLRGIDDTLPIVISRLRTLIVENKSYEYILDKYDSKDTLFYLDPPYIHDTRQEKSRDIYDHEMTNDMHKDLVKRLLNIKGKFILSGYDHPIYAPLSEGKFKKIKLGSFVKTCAPRFNDETRVDLGEEYLWINFEIGQ